MFPFSGIGGGAHGALAAEIKTQGYRVKFRSLGGFDFNLDACTDFEMLTDSRGYCLAMEAMTVDVIRSIWPVGPDLVLMSPPCKSFSSLTSDSQAATPKYVAMSNLAVLWLRRSLEAWKDHLPGLILFENVPRIASRGRPLLEACYSIFKEYGYVMTESTHDCGELGGLAQKRKRFLLAARNPSRVAQLLYEPIKRRVRACGEVLGQLPMPDDPSMGPMHVLPGISWLNSVRLALIPAGGDWRDLPGVLEEHQARREKFRRQRVEDWEEPSATVAGPGGNGPQNVADPRIKKPNQNKHWNKHDVRSWQEPAGTVIGATRPGSGAPSVADPRIDPDLGFVPQTGFAHTYHVTDWDDPAGTVTTGTSVSSGGTAVADPRPVRDRDTGFNSLMVVPWEEPGRTVTSEARSTTGPFSVADPRIKTGYDHAYRVLSMNEPSFVVHGKAHPGTGAYSVADPRLNCSPRAGAWGVLSWDEAAKTVIGVSQISKGPFAVADPRTNQILCVIRDRERAPHKKPNQGFAPLIVSKDGTWHRPMTTLELAVLQALPVKLKGRPLVLTGKSHTAWRERIGNCIPSDTMKAIAEEMLLTLLYSKISFSISGGSTIWVETDEEVYPVILSI